MKTEYKTKHEKDWVTRAGLRAVCIKHPSMGHRCGYVAVSSDHPLHGVGYSENNDVLPESEFCGSSPEGYFEVHGGLTYAEDHAPGSKPDGDWWFGFDCAHAGDYVPGLGSFSEGVERTLEFVQQECESLAQQLVDAHLGGWDN